MNALMFMRICAHSGFGIRLEDHPLRSAIERLFQEQRHAPHRDVGPVAVTGVVEARDRARPQITKPAGMRRKQFTPSGLRTPFCLSVRMTSRSIAPTKAVLSPAGAFHTPRAASVDAYMPAIMPEGPT